jgi:hypothetical protein
VRRRELGRPQRIHIGDADEFRARRAREHTGVAGGDTARTDEPDLTAPHLVWCSQFERAQNGNTE